MAQFTTDSGILRLITLLNEDVTHIAVGSGAAPTTASTTLNSEFARKSIVDPLIDGFTLVVDTYFDETEANGSITSWGVFGDGATAGANSGKLVAVDSDAAITKTSGESLTLSAEITIRRPSV